MTQAEVSSSQLDIPAPGRYRIDAEHSTVTFTTRHFFGLGAVRGTFGLRDGVVSVADPVTESGVWARVAASSFRTGNDTRDATVLSPKLLGAEAYPSLAFNSTQLAREDGQWRLRGELEVRGVARPAEARIGAVAVDEASGTLRASARLTIDRHAFGVSAYRGMIARTLTVDLAITARRERS